MGALGLLYFLPGCFFVILPLTLFSVGIGAVGIGDLGEMFVCQPGEYVPLTLKCDGEHNCVNGEDEAVRECGCLSNEFQCDDEMCLDIIHRCDTKLDCKDGQDELGCDNYVCPATHTKCDNHFCIPIGAVCDYKDDCGDGSDELECSKPPCYKGQFRCSNGQCIMPTQICDGGEPDCNDGSDEQQCHETDFRRCGSGRKIHRNYWCDGWPDCHDNHIDELNCTFCNEETHFTCPNSQCIFKSNVCDSFCDCASDCADEANCTDNTYTTIKGTRLCDVGSSLTFLVPNLDRSKDRCVRSEFICDGRIDSHTGEFLSDEYGCGSCPNEKSDQRCFKCKDGRFLPEKLQCDYKFDCLHGDDELNCSLY